MKTAILAVVAVLSAGCADQPRGPVGTSCPAGPLGAVELEVGTKLSCGAVPALLVQAKAVLVADTAISPDDWEQRLASTTLSVHVRAADWWWYSGSPTMGITACAGTSRVCTVDLNSAGDSFAHESLHVYDFARGVDSWQHEGWGPEGYFRADSDFTARF
jgi:hypothetical protein